VKKRPFQFGLSTLFVVMTLWAVFCSIAIAFGLPGVVLTILAVWLAVIIRAFIRKKYDLAFNLFMLPFLILAVLGLLVVCFSIFTGLVQLIGK
jgi:hypothetical protein